MTSNRISENVDEAELSYKEHYPAKKREVTVPVDRKLQVIMAELSYVQGIIEHEMDQKTRSRTWAVTSFSALFALAIHQSNESILLLTIPAILLFWFVDSTRQGTHSVMVQRSIEIQKFLRNPTDDKILAFESPAFGEQLTDQKARDRYTRKSIFRRYRVIFYGSMISGAAIMYIFLRFSGWP